MGLIAEDEQGRAVSSSEVKGRMLKFGRVCRTTAETWDQ